MTELIEFKSDKILGLGQATFSVGQKTASQPPKKKRRVANSLAIDNLHYAQVNEHIATTFDFDAAGTGRVHYDGDIPKVTLAERRVEVSSTVALLELFFSDITLEESGFEHASANWYTFTSHDVKMMVPQGHTHLIQVKNKPKQGLKKTDLLLSIAVPDVDWHIMHQEVALAKELPVSRAPENLFVTGPTLTVEVDVVTLKVRVELYYKLEIGQLVVVPNTLGLINSIDELLAAQHLTVVPTVYDTTLMQHSKIGAMDPISSQLFYTCVSDKTSSMPAVDAEFDIPELDVELLRFQRKTLSWLLEKEGMKYNTDTNRCEQIPTITPELKHALESGTESDATDGEVHLILNKVCHGWHLVKLHEDLFWYNQYTGNIGAKKLVNKYLIDTYYDVPLQFTGMGLLTEEMGLGKTVEVAALTILNQRPTEEVNKPVMLSLQPYGDKKKILKTRTTLIIAPDAIIQQWVDEFVRLAPSLSITVYEGLNNHHEFFKHGDIIATFLSNFDVVVCSYTTLSNELDYAKYTTSHKKTRVSRIPRREDTPGKSDNDNNDDNDDDNDDGSYDQFQLLFQLSFKLKKPPKPNEQVKKRLRGSSSVYEEALKEEIKQTLLNNKDVPKSYSTFHHTYYQTPLMLIHWWRVVLDEVQMVSSKVSRAFQSASLIPRHHSWGVSGTPIRRNYDDLNSVLTFLKVNPFCEGYYSKPSWERLTNSNGRKNLSVGNTEFIKLWSSLAIRHTKLMVHDDIKLPPQNRVLLSLPFNAVEQENYTNIFENFLLDVGFDKNGNPQVDDWQPDGATIAKMASHLVRLRQACCAPQVGNMTGNRRYRSTSQFYDKDGKSGDQILQLQTLENVLDGMMNKVRDSVFELEKDAVQIFLEVGEFFEYLYLPHRALKAFNIGAWKSEKMVCRMSKYLENLIAKHKELSNKKESNLTEVKDENNQESDENDDDVDLDENNAKSNSRSKKVEKSEEVSKLEDTIAGTRLRLRSWYVLLHKFYFLIASSHFQQYDDEYQQRMKDEGKYHTTDFSINGLDIFDQEIDDVYTIEDTISPLLVGCSTDEVKPFNSLLSYDKDSEDSPHKFQEQFYYNLAEKTREKILESSIKGAFASVESRITNRQVYHKDKESFVDSGDILIPKSSKKLFKYLPLIDISSLESEFIIGMQSKIFYTKVQNLVDQLNIQSSLINTWMDELLLLLSKPLLSLDKDPNGAEYEESIDDQDKVSCYLHVLTSAMEDRALFISDKAGPPAKKRLDKLRRTQQDALTEESLSNPSNKEFLLNLQNLRAESKPTLLDSLQNLEQNGSIIESELALKNEKVTDMNNAGSLEYELFQEFITRIRKIVDNQKLSDILLQKELGVNCNAVFNSRIEYFKQLQLISDTVRSTWERDFQIEIDTVKDNFNKFILKQVTTEQTFSKTITKFRYLRTLIKPDDEEDEIDEDDDSMMCIICRCTITVGSLTQCGHKYCRECLEHWLTSSSLCPMCKSAITPHSIYNFTQHKADLKAKAIHDNLEGDAEEGELHEKAAKLNVIYKSLGEDVILNIQEVELKSSYSTKVDMIVKQILYLKSKEHKVQIVVFSQWQDMLHIIRTALIEHSVKVEISNFFTRVRPNERQLRVENFKKEGLDITCYLLNAKAQASGLTLVNATHIFLCEPLVNTSVELQAISRIHRIGQKRETTVWMFAIENTVEESIVVMSTNNRLKYFEKKAKKDQLGDGDSDDESTSIEVVDDAALFKAESGLINSGTDHNNLGVNAGGESVTTGDLWSAFFSATATKQEQQVMNIVVRQ